MGERMRRYDRGATRIIRRFDVRAIGRSVISMAAPRMRTIKQCIEYFKQEDPDTSIGEYYLRGLVKQGKIPVFHAGRKQLINLDSLVEYFNSMEHDAKEITVKPGIRRVEV